MRTDEQVVQAREWIAEGNHTERMTAEEFAAIRERLGWTQRRLALYLGVTEQMARGYEAGRYPVQQGKANQMRLTALVLPQS